MERLFLSLCLAFCVVTFVLVILESGKNARRAAAIVRYIDYENKLLKEKIEALESRVKSLESGASPDIEKAKEAAEAVNNFNAGITAILGYDPFAALEAERNKGGETR